LFCFPPSPSPHPLLPPLRPTVSNPRPPRHPPSSDEPAPPLPYNLAYRPSAWRAQPACHNARHSAVPRPICFAASHRSWSEGGRGPGARKHTFDLHRVIFQGHARMAPPQQRRGKKQRTVLRPRPTLLHGCGHAARSLHRGVRLRCRYTRDKPCVHHARADDGLACDVARRMAAAWHKGWRYGGV
jgi:hypothetical protein